MTGQPAPRPVAALGVGGPHSAPWRGAEERQPCGSLRPPLAAEASPAWGQRGWGKGAIEPAQRGEGRRGEGREWFVKLAEIPPQLAAAGGAARSFLKLLRLRISPRRDSHSGFNFVVAAPAP